MNKIFDPPKSDWEEILKRPSPENENLEKLVKEIFEKILEGGDKEVAKFTSLFDGVKLANFQVSEEEIREAEAKVSEELKAAITLAKENISLFHSAQKTEPTYVETMPGVFCWQEKKPIQKIGLYIPGGTAPLFSTVLMLAIPAKIAGCEEIVLCTPPDKNGQIHPAILYAAKVCGVTNIIKVGGIQAIAGMTFGTNSIPKVFKIFGPGNSYVTAAKQMATKYNVSIDMPAGPSELIIVADESANASFVAADLLSQAEHGKDSQVILITTSKNFMNKVETEVAQQLSILPRKEIARAAMENSKLIYLEDESLILEMLNQYAPEHLIICSENETFFTDGIQNAGSVFLGNYSAESVGDYASGTNHTLPTNGFAKQYSGVNLDSFLKAISFQKLNEEGLIKIGPSIEIMAEAEGLQAHKNAISLRLNAISKNRNPKWKNTSN